MLFLTYFYDQYGYFNQLIKLFTLYNDKQKYLIRLLYPFMIFRLKFYGNPRTILLNMITIKYDCLMF